MSRGAPLLAGVLLLSAHAHAATLRGHVVGPDSLPVAGALVTLPTAAPVIGVGVTCPSCYAECRSRATTDAEGAFAIPRLGDSLMFEVLVTAKGFAPWLQARVHADGAPLVAKLLARDLARVPDSLLVRGRVLDPLGQPVARARVTPVGFRSGSMRSFGDSGGDRLAVSDERGDFELVVAHEALHRFPDRPPLPDSARTWFLEVEARGLASHTFPDVPSGSARTPLRMRRGANLGGRVERDGQPLAGVVVGLCSLDRNAADFTGEMRLTTNAEGAFCFVGVAPDDDAMVYGTMDSFAPYGGAPSGRFRTAPDAITSLTGTLSPSRARVVRGRVMLAAGGAPPAGTRVMLSRSGVRDFTIVRTDANGAFAFAAAPEESLVVSTHLAGTHLLETTPGFDRVMRSGVVVPARGDVDGLVLAFAPGDTRYPPVVGRLPGHSPADSAHARPAHP